MSTVNIRVSPETRDSLTAIGSKGETYDGIIRRLVEDSRLYREVLGGTGIRDIPDIEKEATE